MIRIVILIFALVAGGGAAWLAYSQLTAEDAAPVAEAPEPIPTRALLVASQAIIRGEKLGPGNLEWQDWPQAAVGEGVVVREQKPEAIEEYTGWTSRATFLPGEPIRPERLAEGHGGMMSVMLSQGMRAVAIPVSAESGAGGFVMPDDRVDLVHTIVRDADGDGVEEPVSRTIISNVRVLAVDQMAQTVEGEEGKAKVASTVTIELTPQQVEALSNARNSGQLSLALRSVADFDEQPTDDVAYLEPRAPPQEVTADRIEAEPAPPPEPEEQEPASIRIIGSGEIQTILVDRGEG